ncbi:MAG: hypothetical protein SF162_05485 [bacterium]|nr:hypothetical protein [bacterium]
MIWASRLIYRNFRYWERAAQIAFVLALVLIGFGVLLMFAAPAEQRVTIVTGLGALILVAQGIVLWANRGMVTVFTQAQRRYLAGDLEGALHLLETARSEGRADVRTLTLLGTTYRQFGRLSESEAVLYEALDKDPTAHFPLYNLGRTMLSAGRYQDALKVLEQSIAAGAPVSAQFDAAEALAWLGEAERAAERVREFGGAWQEPYRRMAAALWLFERGQGEPPSPDLIRDGLPYWQAAAQRFAHTPYGTVIQAHILVPMQVIMEGEGNPNVR